MKAYSMATALRHPGEVTELYLSGEQWQTVPPQIFELTNLRVLEISRCGLTALTDSIGKLQQLERLFLAGNRLGDLPPAIEDLSGLRQLDLSGNALASFPEAAARLSSLEVLNLAGNALRSFPLSLTRLPQLRDLDLGSCRLSSLPSAVGRLGELQRLTLNGNALRKVPAALFDLHKLTVLDLSNNRLDDFPALPAACWPVLGQLQLADNRLPTVPDGIESCRLLQRLDLSGNKLVRCPTAIAGLPWLSTLDLGRNKLRQLPAALGNCAQLEALDLRHNPLQVLPALPATLRRLTLRRCALTEVPAAVATATSLRTLDLSYNKITALPPQLGKLKQLRRLDLRANAIRTLPEVLLRLDQLEALHGSPATPAGPLLSFLRACRRDDTPDELRLPLFTALRGDHLPLSKLPTPSLLRALRFPLGRAARTALTILTGERGSKQPLGPGARIAVIGQTTFKKDELERRLPPRGLYYCPALDRTTTHLVIGLKPAEMPLPGIERQCAFLAENTLIRYLEKAEGRHLAAAPAGKLDHLQQLLLSGQPANIRLALQLLLGGGVPPALHTDLLVAWKTTTDRRLRRELRILLERHIAAADKRVLSLPVSLSKKLPAAQLRRNIEKLTSGTAFDADRIWQSLKGGQD